MPSGRDNSGIGRRSGSTTKKMPSAHFAGKAIGMLALW